MARVVVVATSPVAREALDGHIDTDDELVVVAPAVEQSRLDWLTNDEKQARDDAEAVGKSIAHESRARGAAVEVKPDPPSVALVDAVAEHDPERILVVLRTGEDAAWLEDGESGRIPDEIEGIPIALVTV